MRLAGFLDGVDEPRFLADNMRKYAVLQQLTVIGEASARLSPEAKAKSKVIPWKRMIGLRNIAVHAYFDVDWKIIWSTASQDINSVRSAIEALLRNSAQ